MVKAANLKRSKSYVLQKRTVFQVVMGKILFVQGSKNYKGFEKGQFLRKHCENGYFHRNSEHTV